MKLAAVAFIAAGTGLATAVTACSSTASSGATPGGTTGSTTGSTAQSDAGYSYYRSVMSAYQRTSSGSAGPPGGPMMGGSPGSGMMGGSGHAAGPAMMTRSGYRWMMGDATEAPGWMRGGRLPGAMMGGGGDPGQVMGELWANAPGPRVGAAQAAMLGNAVPAGASADRAGNRLVFTSAVVRLTVVAGPAGGPDETFRVAGMVNPQLVVPAGANVTIEVINADPDTAHGMTVTAAGAAAATMPMMAAQPAFAGAATWFLGDPTSAGLHAATMTFTASVPGTYAYLCAVPGHASKGMRGKFTVGPAA